MKKQVFNPFLPSYEYLPDPEPHIFGDRVYVYGSHDKFNGISFCLLDYVCWSAPIKDLSDWRCEGVIYRRRQDPKGRRGVLNALFAPDVCRGADGRYYLYYFLGYRSRIGVAVCDRPAGKYKYYGQVRYEDGVELGARGEPLQFDPGVFADDDGNFYLYTGFSPEKYPAFLLGGHRPSPQGAMGFALEKDMLTVKGAPAFLGVPGRAAGKDTPYKGHEFFEAASMRKFGGKYYFIYSSAENHELCYAVSNHPLHSFEFGGTLVSIGDVGLDGVQRNTARNYLGNTHGSILKVGEKYYVFYHRQTNRNSFSRQTCAEELQFRDGKFLQAELTSCGLNAKPLEGKGEYGAYIACNLWSAKGTLFYGAVKKRKGRYPYFTQTGKDRENRPDQYIANFCDGSVAVFKYFSLTDAREIGVRVRGKCGGTMEVYADGVPAAQVGLPAGKGERTFFAPFAAQAGVRALSFVYRGKGRADFVSFILK